MSLDVAQEERERRALLLRSVDLLLKGDPSLEGSAVSLLMIQKGCIRICDADEAVIPRWVFSRASLGKLMKDLGFYQKRTDLRRYLLETKHTTKLLKELRELEELAERTRLNLPEFLNTFARFKCECLKKLKLNEESPYEADLKLTKYMLTHMKKLKTKDRAVLKPLLRKHLVCVELTVKELARAPWESFPVTKRVDTIFEPMRELKKLEPDRELKKIEKAKEIKKVEPAKELEIGVKKKIKISKSEESTVESRALPVRTGRKTRVE